MVFLLFTNGFTFITSLPTSTIHLDIKATFFFNIQLHIAFKNASNYYRTMIGVTII